MTTVRRATIGDLPRLSTTLALAFADYPWTDWTVAADDRHHRLAGLFAVDVREFGLKLGEVWVAEDCAAVAVWMPPSDAGDETEGPREDPTSTSRAEREALIGDRLPQAEEAGRFVEAHRPKAPHWYLASVGTRPDRQGRGLGSIVLAPVLECCDAEGMPAYTETSAPRNVGFYRRHGFEVISELDVPGGGPHVWLMWREPRRASEDPA